MEFFTTKTHIPFMQQRYYAFGLSMVMIIGSCLSIALFGLNMSLDFTGGHQVQLQFEQAPAIDTVRSAIHSTKQVTVYTLGSSKQILMKIPHDTHLQDTNKLRQHLEQSFPEAKISQLSFIGPQIGAALLFDGVNAMIIALLCTMVYIAMRFEYRFAISALIALLHDPIITLGIFSFYQVEFDIISLAGILTVLGYSLNDTIVVYDRIRENYQANPKHSIHSIVDRAINDTLSRTIITSGLTLLAVLALCFFGGATLWGFSLALAIGIVVGTYSSIYVAGALSVVIGLQAPDLDNQTTRQPHVL